MINTALGKFHKNFTSLAQGASGPNSAFIMQKSGLKPRHFISIVFNIITIIIINIISIISTILIFIIVVVVVAVSAVVLIPFHIKPVNSSKQFIPTT